MTLYYAPAIVFGASRFYLPPEIEGEITRSQTVEGVSPPQTDQYIITSVRPNQGTRIRLSVSGKDPSAQTTARVLAWMEEMWANLSGPDKTFDFFLFSDRAWSGCALETHTERFGIKPMVRMDRTELSIICESSEPDTSKQLTFSNYETEYPYAALVGRPLGNAVIPGTVTPVGQPSIQTLPGMFPGVVSVTAPGAEIRMAIGGTTGSSWRLESLQIVSADNVDATGTTTVKVSTGGVGTVAPNIQASVGSGEKFSLVVPGSVDVTAGNTLYAYVTAAGGHQNVQIVARIRSLS